jgi:uncharacterized protein (DUF2252 family)
MAASPFAFYRGAAAIMAADLKDTPTSGLRAQICGDAHLANFGGFGSPERELLFDINDFDETLPGPWEWDVKRLATSLQIAGENRGFSARECRGLVLAVVSSYRQGMREFAAMPHLGVWYSRLDLAGVQRRWGRELSSVELQGLEKSFSRDRARDNSRAVEKLTVRVDGKLRIASHPPLVVSVEELYPPGEQQELEQRIRLYLHRIGQSMQGHVRRLVERYRYVHLAHKVVGVGSVGLRAWIVLLMGRGEQDLLFMQLKEAQASALEPYLAKSHYVDHGERVVEGQRLMQAASDIFLSWERVVGLDNVQRDFYARQLWDWKVSADVETMKLRGLQVYGQMCGWTLARAHARSGDRVAIAGYLGKGQDFDQAIAQFAAAYAAQNTRDYQALRTAITNGQITAQMGV